MTLRNRMTFWSVLSIGMASSLVTCKPNDPLQQTPPVQQQDKGVGACAPEALATGRILASTTLIRASGKPTQDTLAFATGANEDVCVLIKTGSEDVAGNMIDPAPASMLVTLDSSIQIARPADFNAKPQMLARRVDAGSLSAGSHELAVELRGKAGKNPGVAYVAVLATSKVNVASTSPISADRLEDPDQLITVVKDEAIVVSHGTDTTQLSAQLGTLPFPALIIGQLQPASIFQVLFPGVEGGQALRDRIAALHTLLTPGHVGHHYIGGMYPNLLPDAGKDPDYVEADGSALKSEAWHLARIRAPEAWDYGTGDSATEVGVIDNGFNVLQLDLVNNLGMCVHTAGGVGAVETCGTHPTQWVAPWTWPECANNENSPACQAFLACYGNAPYPSEHGTEVAGLVAAEGGTNHPGADAVGIMWTAGLYLSRTTDTFFNRESQFVPVAVANAMASAGVRVVNLSYGFRHFCQDGTSTSVDQKMLDLSRDTWSEILSAHQKLLVVQAAGNEGARGVEAVDAGHACSITDPALANRVLCVTASTKLDKLASFANRGGDMLAAPGENVRLLSETSPTGSGTSYAAPLVAGAAGLLLSLNPDLSTTQLHDILLGTASPTVTDPQDSSKTYRLLDVGAAAEQSVRCRAGTYVQSDYSVDICPSFDDVPADHWAYPAIRKLACDCVLQGYSDGTFRPAQNVNRVEFLKIVLELAFAGNIPESSTNPYNDVLAGNWYTKYVALAKEKGIIDGTVSNFFPGKEIVRAEAVKILVEAAAVSPAGNFQYLADSYDFIQTGTPSGFADVISSDWFYYYVYAADAQCVVTGYPDGTFKPAAHMNRAEAAKVGCIARYGIGPCVAAGQQNTCTPVFPM